MVDDQPGGRRERRVLPSQVTQRRAQNSRLSHLYQNAGDSGGDAHDARSDCTASSMRRERRNISCTGSRPAPYSASR